MQNTFKCQVFIIENQMDFTLAVCMPLGAKVVYICSSFWLLAPGSHDFSQAKKKVADGEAEQIQKMTTMFNQNDNF